MFSFNHTNKFLPGTTRVIVTIVVFFVVAILATVGYFAFKVNSIYQSVQAGKNDLNQAIVFMDRGELELAQRTAKEAIESFSNASQELSELQNNFFIKNLARINNDFKNLNHIAASAEVLSRSAENAFTLISEFEEVFSGKKVAKFSEFSASEKTLILQKLYESRPEMQGIKANLDLALFYLNQNQGGYFSNMFSLQMDEFKEQLEQASMSLDNLVSLSALVPVLAGYPEPASYLIVLQNNNELRPSGGFIGTYGLLTVSLGDITKLETHDSYHLDMPASLNKSFKVIPPAEIKKYLGVENWYLRDSNWSPDFAVSAKQIEWFYQEEMKAAKREAEILPLAGVIAVTPDLITDLIKVVGEIEVDGQKYNADNFVEILQYEVEMAFREEGISEWDRKNVIGKILSELKIKLFDLDSNSWKKVAGVFSSSISKKNILVYLNNPSYQQNSSDLNWDGKIKESSLDYLMVVDANLAAYKTDRVMDKKIKYYLTEQSDGRFKARVEMLYKNNGWFDWQTTRYRSFTRVYYPLNSAFISDYGFENGSVVSALEAGISYPKSYSGGFMSIEPKKEATLVFEYYLPEEVSAKIKKEKKYSLILQKQAGNNSSFEMYFKFLNPITSWSKNVESDIVEKANNDLKWQGDLNQDRYLTVTF